MKLTTLKVSVPVLMMMLFQSGYGVSDWFGRACVAAINEGNTLEAQRIMVENNPSSVTMTDEAKVDFINDLGRLILETIDGFVPRRFTGVAKEGFMTEAVRNMAALQDVTADTVKDSFTKTIVDTFYANLGWLGRNADVAKEVTDVTTTWAQTDVPQDGTDPRYDAFVGTEETPGENTVWEFIKGAPHTEEAGPGALNKLLNHDYLSKLVATTDFTYATIDTAISGAEEGHKVEAVITTLTTQANNVVRFGVIPEKDDANVPWGSESAADWKADAKENIDEAWGNVGEDRTAEALRKALHDDSAQYIIDNLEAVIADSDELSYFLNLFGYWQIKGNHDPESPDDMEQFLQSILAEIPEEGATVNDVNNAVYSRFGTTYEDSLRHTAADPAADLPRQTTLVNDMIKATNEAETKAAAEKVVETLDGDASNTVAQAGKDIKQVIS